MIKKFLIMGNKNAVACKEIFPLIKNNHIWLGIHIGNMWFRVPDNFIPEIKNNGYKEENGKKMRSVQGITWFTNLTHSKRNQKLTLYKKYDPKEFPKYDNYDAIEVSKVSDIPMDYDGVMGVPISFLEKFCPEQFEIITCACGNSWANYTEILKSLNFNPNIKYGGGLGSGVINGKAVYSRIFIRHKK